MSSPPPLFSVVIPTHDNVEVLKQCLAGWQQHADGASVELLVIEDGCKDGTADFLRAQADTPWGQRHLRWFHEEDVHELNCDNRGFREARGQFLLVWHDDMHLRANWLLPELACSLRAHPEIGLISLSRGLMCHPVEGAISTWEELLQWDRLESTIGTAPLNWLCFSEVDIVVRPWVVRRECLDTVGALDPAFVPTEWDEADLCFRLREGGWKVATHGYEREGAYVHLLSSTMSKTPSERLKANALRNGKLFHARWDAHIAARQGHRYQRWRRRFAGGSFANLLGLMLGRVTHRA
ncbi:MAG TPA: glycosyltransferase [Vicinamibacterales bacterium]|nr:glycosyltransferase [Vicinamibacterales bacterium]